MVNFCHSFNIDTYNFGFGNVLKWWLLIKEGRVHERVSIGEEAFYTLPTPEPWHSFMILWIKFYLTTYILL